MEERIDSVYVGAKEIGAGAGEISRAARTWATSETGATVIGVASGIFAGEYLGSLLTEYLNIEEGWTKVIVKAIAKGSLSFVLFYIARRTGGMSRLLLNGASAGALASVIGDIVGEYVAPGMLGVGACQPSSPSSQSLTIRANPTKNIPISKSNPSNVINIPVNASGVGKREHVIRI